MLAKRSGKAQLNGFATVHSVYYLGHCGVTVSAAAEAKDVRFDASLAVSELLARGDGRKAYMTVTPEGLKLHLTDTGENRLTTPERIAYYCAAAAGCGRIFAWVDQLPSLQFVCHAAAFRQPEQALEMVALTRHFLAAVYRDWHKIRRRLASEAGSGAASSGGTLMRK